MTTGVDVLAVHQARKGEFHTWTGDNREQLKMAAVKMMSG